MKTATPTEGPISRQAAPVTFRPTAVRIKLMAGDPGGNTRLAAFASIVIDGVFVIRDVKVIATDAGPFVAMPSRKLCDHCPWCAKKNHLLAHYCNHCGQPLGSGRVTLDDRGFPRLHADVAHPISRGARDAVQSAVLAAYDEELRLSRLPGYVPRYEWEGDDEEGGGA